METRIQKETEAILAALETRMKTQLAVYESNGCDNRDIKDEIVRRVWERRPRPMTVHHFTSHDKQTGELKTIVTSFETRAY